MDILTKFHFLSAIYDYYSTLFKHPVLDALREIIASFPIKTTPLHPAERATIQLSFPKSAQTELSYNVQLIEWYSNVDTFFIESLETYMCDLEVLHFTLFYLAILQGSECQLPQDRSPLCNRNH